MSLWGKKFSEICTFTYLQAIPPGHTCQSDTGVQGQTCHSLGYPQSPGKKENVQLQLIPIKNPSIFKQNLTAEITSLHLRRKPEQWKHSKIHQETKYQLRLWQSIYMTKHTNPHQLMVAALLYPAHHTLQGRSLKL